MVTKRSAGSPLGVHAKKKSLVPERHPLKKKKKKQYFKKAFDYLFSDDYMFAPLLSSHFSSSTSSIGIEESAMVNDKDFVEKVGDYLKSDCYLYSPLVITQPWLNSCAHAVASQRGLHGLLEKKDRSKSEDLLKESDKTDKQPVEKIAISVNKEQNSESLPHDRSTVIKRTRVQRETVKHMIFQNCLLCL